MPDLYCVSEEEVSAILTSNIRKLSDSFSTAYGNAVKEYTTLQQQGLKEELEHVYISFLRSSVVDKREWFRIDLYDTRDMADLVECCAYWNITPFLGDFYKRYPKPTVQEYKLGATAPWIVEAHWIGEAEKYVAQLQQIMPQIAAASRIQENEGIKLHFGEYLGTTALIDFRKEAEVM